MSLRLGLIVCLLACFSLTPAAERKEQGRYLAIPIKGNYYMYGGTMSDMQPPTMKDRKISFMLSGQLAKDLSIRLDPMPNMHVAQLQDIGRDVRAISPAYWMKMVTVAISG
jgi:hypothetical protein